LDPVRLEPLQLPRVPGVWLHCHALASSPGAWGVGGQDALLDLAVPQTAEELAHAQVVGADAVDGVDGAAEHVVEPPVLAGALDGDDVLGLLDDADDALVAAGVAADGALGGLGDVAAGLAEADLGLDGA